MDMDRRRFLQGSVLALGTLGVGGRLARAEGPAPTAGTLPLSVATYEFGLPATQRALAVLDAGGTVLDAVEEGVRLVETDNPDGSVGPGGRPDAEGVVQLDACIMGPDRHAGSIAALEGFAHPISVARRVMEKTRHVMLVGEGAARFARSEGMEPAPPPTEEQRRRWERWQARHRPAVRDTTHDTLALLVVDAKGQVAGGCSTSGWAFKLPGRVGDSPIIGSGLYVDGEVGAAGATGLGEDIMRYCGSFLIVELMRQGRTPQQACQAAVERIGRGEAWKDGLEASFVAVNTQGQWGAAGTVEGFACAVANRNGSRVEGAPVVRGPAQ